MPAFVECKINTSPNLVGTRVGNPSVKARHGDRAAVFAVVRAIPEAAAVGQCFEVREGLPDRIPAAVLAQPVGWRPEMRDPKYPGPFWKSWGPALHLDPYEILSPMQGTPCPITMDQLYAMRWASKLLPG
jgi:hypothetical protein